MPKRISIIGNLILDRKYSVENFSSNYSNTCTKYVESVGAVGNMLPTLLNTYNFDVEILGAIGNDTNGMYIENSLNKSKVKFNPIIVNGASTSTATIVSDIVNSTRTSVVNWDACIEFADVEVTDSDWCHICYLDSLINIDNSTLHGIKSKLPECIISADLCSSDFVKLHKNRIWKCLKYIDYLVISDTEANALLPGLDSEIQVTVLGHAVNKYCIIHSPKGSCISDGSSSISHICTSVLRNIDVLGAGDIFCANMIGNLLKYKENDRFDTTLRICVQESHQQTSLTLGESIDE